MRALVAYAVAASIVAVALAFNLNAAQHRIAALERQLAPTPPTVAATTPARGARTFTSSAGVVLTAGDLARLDAEDRALDEKVAEYEYFMSKQPLPNTRDRHRERP